MNKKKTTRNVSIEKSSGNVYTDLAYPDSDSMLIKAQLVANIAKIIRVRGLSQTEAAVKLGLTQPRLSALLKGQFRGVSERRLLDCLTRLGRDVRIVIRPVPKSRRLGQLSVTFS
jgi:predicted XRE-type DNA-binding protein